MSDQIDQILYRCAGFYCWNLVEQQGELCSACKKPRFQIIITTNMNTLLPADRQEVGNEPIDDFDEED